MKKPISFALLSLFVGTVSSGAPSLAIGEATELFLTGTVGVRADDNILLASNSESDLIFDLNPGVDLEFGKDSQVKGSLALADAFANYSDHSELNTNLFTGDFTSTYDDGKFKLGFNASYHELNQNTFQTRGLIRRDVFMADGSSEIEVSPITAVAAGLAFNHEHYKRKGFLDSDSLELPLTFYYKWTPKLDLSLGYRYRDYTVAAPGQDSTDQFFSIGARGEYSPKLTGKIAVGLNSRKLTRGGTEQQLGVDASLTYEISPKTSALLGMSNDFGTSPQGEQQKNFSLNGAITTKLTTVWSVNGGLTYRNINYRSRSDDYYEGQIGAAYVVNEHIQIVGAYVHRKFTTDQRGSGFSNNVFALATNLRY